MANWICPSCGLSNISERTTCKQCGTAKSVALGITPQPSESPGTETNSLTQQPSAGSSLTGIEVSQEYKMVQIPRTFRVQGQDNEAAVFLQNLVNEHFAVGWEFYRIDEIGVVSTPGCLGSLLGAKEAIISYYIVTFRRLKT